MAKTLSIAQAMHSASAAYEAGDMAKAEQLCRAIIAAKPNHFDANHLLAIVLSRTDRPEEALASCERALAVGPGNAILFNNHGNILHALERDEDALASYDRALALDPGNSETLLNRAVCLRALTRYEEALAICDQVIAAKPADASAHYNRGNVLKDLQRFDEALASYDRAIASKPGYTDAFNNRGNVLLELRRPEDALANFERWLALAPDGADAYLGRGNALLALGRTEDAVAAYGRAVALSSQPALAHWNRAVARLTLGDFAQGWAEYEWRWKSVTKADYRDLARPLWLGKEDLRGKTILLHGEQGLGDTIQFCRYARLVAERGARVLLEVPRSLVSTLKGIAGPAQILAKGDPLPEFDFQCPLMSLPLAFATRLASIPADLPYLSQPPARIGALARIISSRRGLRVGLVWAGNPRYTRDRDR